MTKPNRKRADVNGRRSLVPTYVGLPPEMNDRVVEIAARRYLDKSDIIREAVRVYLQSLTDSCPRVVIEALPDPAPAAASAV